MIYLSIYRCFCRESECHIHEGEYNCKYECHPESTDTESRDESCYQEYHEDIDDEGHKPKCEYIERESENIQYWNNGSINYCEYNSNDEGS